MSHPDFIPTAILAPKPEKPRRKKRSEQIPWAKIAIGGTVVWMFVIGIVTIYFSVQNRPTRNPNEERLDEEPLNVVRPVKREIVAEKKPVEVAKADEPAEALDLFPIVKGEFVDCEQIGTDVRFMKEPAEAFKRARDEKKMVFMVHLSGNLEDKDFT